MHADARANRQTDRQTNRETERRRSPPLVFARAWSRQSFSFLSSSLRADKKEADTGSAVAIACKEKSSGLLGRELLQACKEKSLRLAAETGG